MVRTISAQEASAHFADLLGTIAETKEPVMVEDAGEPVAVLISPDEFREYARERFWRTVDEIRKRNADKDPDEVLRDMTAVVEEVRQERYEQSRRSAHSSR